MILMDGRRVVWKVRKAMLGSRTSPRRWQEHLSSKLKEHGFVQDERDPCLFANTELDICIGVHLDDMLAVGPSELTRNLLQELAKDMAMRWGMVTDKPEEFLGRSLCRTPQGYTFGVSCDCVTKLSKDLVSRNLMTMTICIHWRARINSCVKSQSGPPPQ